VPVADGAVDVTLPDALKRLDKTFLCAENLSPTTTNLRIEHLTNGMPYKVVLLVMDKFGNATGTYFTSTLIPHEVTDFWEDLHGAGNSQVEGGLCLLAETYGNDSVLTKAL